MYTYIENLVIYIYDTFIKLAKAHVLRHPQNYPTSCRPFTADYHELSSITRKETDGMKLQRDRPQNQT